MANLIALEGNAAVAQAMRQINPDVVAAYPITPQTEVVQEFAKFVADGKVDTEFVAVESEHSAMSVCVGASSSGVRVMTATSANGMALMWEILYIAASTRLPIVMGLANRALSGNINIHCDHSDSMGARDAGWLQLYCENSQEAYDTLIQAIRIAERMDVRVPAMVCYDGFVISHAVETVEILDDDQVKAFIGPFEPSGTLLDAEHPMTVGPLDLYDFYFEHKRGQIDAYGPAKQAILDIGKEYGELSGRTYGLFETYKLDDAEVAIVVLGSAAGTTKEVIDGLRSEGRKVGLLRIRAFRPFPVEEIVQALSGVKAIAVMDRSVSFGGFGGPVFNEIRSALYGRNGAVPVADYIYGLGGRDVGILDIRNICDDLAKIADTGQVEQMVNYVAVRE